MLDELAGILHNANEVAKSTAFGYLPDVYATNHNWSTYTIEKQAKANTSYVLFDKMTVERLMRENPKLLPDPRKGSKTERKLAENKDLRWNRQKLSSAITQGIIQGESIPKIANRLGSVADMDHRAAIRNARTMVTGAQNAGRMDAARRANAMGLPTVNVWVATLDMRTRHEHRVLDGQRRDVDVPFEADGYKIRYPGDPEAAPSMVYNCRCTIIQQTKGDEWGIHDNRTDYSAIEGMSYDEWKKDRREKPNPITLPEEKAEAIKQSYIAEYRKLAGSGNGGGDNTPMLNEETTEPVQNSFIEELENHNEETARREFYDVFGDKYDATKDIGTLDWIEHREQGKNDVQDRITRTIASLQQRYPMQTQMPMEYRSTADRLVVTNYRNVPNYLKEGISDRRYIPDDVEVLAQVFFEHDGDITTAVMGFNTYSDTSITDALKHREEVLESDNFLSSVLFFNPEGTAIHEWGHVYAEHMTSAFINGDPDAMEYWEWYKSLSYEEKRDGISLYATENRGEFEAECFLEMQLPNPRPLALKWWDYMERIKKKGY